MQKLIMAFMLMVVTCSGVFAMDEPSRVLEGQIRRLIGARTTIFPPHHPRNTLFAPVIEAFNRIISHSPDYAELKDLGNIAIMAKLSLFKLHNLRIWSEEGQALYDYDNRIISNIFDYTQAAMDEDFNLRDLNALSVLSDRVDTRELMEILPAPEGIDDFVERIWPVLSGHGLVVARDVAKENIRSVLKLLVQIPVS